MQRKNYACIIFSFLLICMCFTCMTAYAALDMFSVDSVVLLVNDSAGMPTATIKSIVVGDTVRFSGTIEGTNLGDLTLAIDKSGNNDYWSDVGYKGIYARLDVVKRDSATWQMTEEQAVTFTEEGCYRIFCWDNSTPSSFVYFRVLPKTPSVVTNVKVDENACASGGEFVTLRNETHTLTYTIGADAISSYMSIGKSNGGGGWLDIPGWSGREIIVGTDKKASVSLDIYEIAAAAGIGNGTLRITIYAGNSRGGVSGAYILWIRIGWKISAGAYANGAMNFYNANQTAEEYISGRKLFQRTPFIIKAKAQEGYYLEKVLITKRQYIGKTEVTDTQIIQSDEPTQGIYQSEPLCFHDADMNEYPEEVIDEIIITPVFREQKMVDVRIANINRKYIDLDFWGLMVVSYTNVGTVYYGTTKDYGYTAKVEKDGEIIDLIEVKRKKVGTTTLYWKVYVDETHQIHEGKTDITVYKAPVTVTANDQTIVYGSSINTAHTSCGAIGVGEYHVLYSAKYMMSTKNVTDNGQIIPYDARFLNADHSEDVTDQYELTYVPGKLVITPKPLIPIVQANNKIYDGTTAASGTISLSGVVSGDDVTAQAASYVFAQKNVGQGIPVTATGIAIEGENAGNYTMDASAIGQGNITARVITPKLIASHKVYDGSTAAMGSLSLSGVLDGDEVNCSASTMAFQDKNKGIGKTVTASGLFLDNKNYTLSQNSVTGVADITAKTLDYRVDADDKVYDGTTIGTGKITLLNIIPGDSVAATAGSYVFAEKNVGTNIMVMARSITLSGADAENYRIISSLNGAADITQRMVTPVLHPRNKEYDGNTVATGTLVLENVIVGDAVVCTADAINFDNKNAGIGKTVTATGLAIHNANYILAEKEISNKADITARTVVVKLQADHKEYDGTTDATGSLELSGIVPGDVVTATAQSYRFAGKNVGNGRTVLAEGVILSGADSANYVMEEETLIGVANIMKKPMTVAAKHQTIALGDDIALGIEQITTTGTVDGDEVTAITLSADLVKGTITPGACRLQDALGADVTGNYEISYLDGIVTIELASLRGDVNCDGAVRMNDLILLLSHLSTSAPLSEQGMINADVTEDGRVLMNDLVVLLTYLSAGYWIE